MIENELRQQILRLHIQNALLMQNFVALNEKILLTFKDMNDRIPKRHEVEKWVFDKNDEDRRVLQDLRDSAIQHLKELREK